ncbi:hypothetical protein AGR5A_Lc30003 [Agrobacterium genomosp. 5 str. CFBP 6626]|nr:hypothetical protein AGR5A_Lc30003 [Agrobacterium genomosp. 5 str. CFBP 6626]
MPVAGCVYSGLLVRSGTKPLRSLWFSEVKFPKARSGAILLASEPRMFYRRECFIL